MFDIIRLTYKTPFALSHSAILSFFLEREGEGGREMEGGERKRKRVLVSVASNCCPIEQLQVDVLDRLDPNGVEARWLGLQCTKQALGWKARWLGLWCTKQALGWKARWLGLWCHKQALGWEARWLGLWCHKQALG